MLPGLNGEAEKNRVGGWAMQRYVKVTGKSSWWLTGG